MKVVGPSSKPLSVAPAAHAIWYRHSMRSADLPCAVVDGQRLLLPEGPALEALEREPTLDGRPLAVGSLFAQFVALSRRAPELRVALGEARESGKPWIVHHVVAIEGSLVRVHVESQVCEACGQGFITALARHYNLFEGAPDPWGSLEAAARHPSVPCPSCGGAFARPPVWVDQASSR